MYIISLHVRHSLFLSDFNDTLIFSKDFRRIPKHKILWKSFQLVPSFSTQKTLSDMTKLIVAFHTFSKVSKRRRNCIREEQTFKMNKVTDPNNTNNIQFYCIWIFVNNIKTCDARELKFTNVWENSRIQKFENDPVLRPTYILYRA
jgi:hypothetical protein